MNDDEKISMLKDRIESYFDYCDSLNNNPKKVVKPYTVSGMLCYIKLSKEEFTKLQRKKKYKQIFDNALARIESFIEERSLNGDLSATYGMNYLKYYFDWGESKESCDDGLSGVVTVYMSGDTACLAK